MQLFLIVSISACLENQETGFTLNNCFNKVRQSFTLLEDGDYLHWEITEVVIQNTRP